MAGLMGGQDAGARGVPGPTLGSILGDADAALTHLAATHTPLARAQELKRWTEAVQALSKRIGDDTTEAVWQAAQSQPSADVAAALGVSKSAVDNRVNAYRKAHPDAPRKDPRP
jgi:hypothetical protein